MLFDLLSNSLLNSSSACLLADCLLAASSACLLAASSACLLAASSACLLAASSACLLAASSACLLAASSACLLASLLVFLQLFCLSSDCLLLVFWQLSSACLLSVFCHSSYIFSLISSSTSFIYCTRYIFGRVSLSPISWNFWYISSFFKFFTKCTSTLIFEKNKYQPWNSKNGTFDNF